MGLRLVMNKGINMAANRGKNPADMTPEERRAAQTARRNGQKARRGVGMLRRFMR